MGQTSQKVINYFLFLFKALLKFVRSKVDSIFQQKQTRVKIFCACHEVHLFVMSGFWKKFRLYLIKLLQNRDKAFLHFCSLHNLSKHWNKEFFLQLPKGRLHEQLFAAEPFHLLLPQTMFLKACYGPRQHCQGFGWQDKTNLHNVQSTQLILVWRMVNLVFLSTSGKEADPAAWFAYGSTLYHPICCYY